MRCVRHTGNSNHYLACSGTKPREAIDYPFDMPLKPGGQEEEEEGGGGGGGGVRTKNNPKSRADKWMETDRRGLHTPGTSADKLSAFVCSGK